MTAPDSPDNLDRLYAAVDALGTSPHDLDWRLIRDEVNNFLVGALSASVDPDTWQEALDVAVRCIEDARQRRAERAAVTA